MRRFTESYLSRTREGMWAGGGEGRPADGREALADLDLSSADRVLDVGCGSGEFTRVLAEESPGRVVGADRDPDLLAAADCEAVRADAHALPFPDGTFDVVACQTLLVNLPDPARALSEFARVARAGGRVAAVEPDNAAVSVESSVGAEAALAARARELYVAGASTDVALGGVRDLFESVGLSDVTVRRYEQTLTVEPPYSEEDMQAIARKAKAADLRERRGVLANAGASEAELDELRRAWREMGREAVRQVGEGSYRRRETVPFYVTVGRV
jgi:SAM-dependent methyltransferase